MKPEVGILMFPCLAVLIRGCLPSGERTLSSALLHTLPSPCQALSDSHSLCSWIPFVMVASTTAVPFADIACFLYASTGPVSLLPPLLFVLSLACCKRTCSSCHCCQAAITELFL